MLVVAPTSSGKTFSGKLAAVEAALSRQHAIFPGLYKVLANKKYEPFAALYGTQLGLRVICCTGNYQDAANASVGN